MVDHLEDSHSQPSMQQVQMHNSMQPAAYNGHHTPEPYRTSPTQHQSSLPHAHAPLLPPIHHFEGNGMQSQQPYAPPMNGAPMQHPPPYNPHQFQYSNGGMQHAQIPPNVAVNGQNGMMRFPIPPQPQQQMIHARGGKVNKDVKRRTKTGCLTCRKRRIKCDETHPACRNCAKSKRECMGYDPIFKQQPGPAPIQPAPTSATTPTQKSAPPSATLPSNSYQQSPSISGSGGSFTAAGGSLAPPNNHSQSIEGQFDGPSLDPALAGSDSAHTMARNSYHSVLQPARKVKHISIDQLFALNDVLPQFQHREAPPPGSWPPQKEIDDYYRFHYAPGLDRMFETTWYTTQGPSHLQQDPALLDFVFQCMERMMSQADDAASINACKSLEARLVWKLATMPRSAPQTDHLTAELVPRISTLEALLTGQFLPEPQIPYPPQHNDPNSSTPDQQNFWHNLGRFTSLRDDTPNPSSLHTITETLSTLRRILRTMENRDVLYSIAIARHIGGRYGEWKPPGRVQAHSEDPNDEVKKLQIACDFVAAEDQKGMTQVIQRVCGMAIRSWVLGKQP